MHAAGKASFAFVAQANEFGLLFEVSDTGRKSLSYIHDFNDGGGIQ